MKLGKSQRDKSEVEVASIAVIRDGALLWIRRADNALWTLPGGHLNPGEEPLDGALRELREETGLTPPESDVEFLGDDLVPGKAYLRIYCFVVEVPSGTKIDLSQDPDQEASDYEWKDELPESEHCHVSHGDNVMLKFLLENDELSKAEQKEWRAKDGLKIPHHTTPARTEWDKAYHKKLVEFFGAGDSQRLKPVKIPITPQTSGTNPVVSKARFSLYTRMLAGGDRLPPAVVRRNGIGWHVVDGNHRLEAALKRGLKEMDAYELVDPPKKTKKSEEPLDKMAIKDLVSPSEPSHQAHRVGHGMGDRYDYSHLLPDSFKGKYKLAVDYHKGEPSKHIGFPKPSGYLQALILRPEDWHKLEAPPTGPGRFNPPYLRGAIGELEGVHHDKIHNQSKDGVNYAGLKVEYAKVHDPAQRGRGLGQAMYEALYAHAFHRLGENSVYGATHSSMAARVHKKLARKHGLKYRADQDNGPPQDGDEAFDDRYDGYDYTLKTALEKAQNPRGPIDHRGFLKAEDDLEKGYPKDDAENDANAQIHAVLADKLIGEAKPVRYNRAAIRRPDEHLAQANAYRDTNEALDSHPGPAGDIGDVERIVYHRPREPANTRFATFAAGNKFGNRRNEAGSNIIDQPSHVYEPSHGYASRNDHDRSDTADHNWWASVNRDVGLRTPGETYGGSLREIRKKAVARQKDRDKRTGVLTKAETELNKGEHKQIGESLTETDARKLASWWNANHHDRHEVRPHDTNFQPGGKNHKKFKVVRIAKAEGSPDLVAATTASLDNSLRKPQYRSSPNPLAGHCYVASEALWHMMGGHESGWVPQNVKHEGDQHWYLRHSKTGQILDPTASQFRTPVPYHQGRGRGFLTKQPSKRAQEVINRVKSKLGKAEELSKGIFSSAALAGAMALGQVGGAEQDPKPAKALVEATQRAGIPAEPVKWSALGLHQALIPIAHLESSFGQNINHGKHPKGDYHTAHGALGFKPVTAHEEYLRAPVLQKLYGDMKDPAVFLNKFKSDPKFYNLLATSHFMRLQKQHGSVERAAYAWRWGTGACQGASDEQVATEPYVMRYRSLAANAGLKKMAIKDIKPGVPVDETTYDYTHLIKSPALRRNYVMHVTHDPSAGQKPMDPNAREPRSIARVTIKHKESGQLVGYVDGSWDRTEAGHKAILPTYSVLRDKALRGKGLGKAMYEALYAHANNHLGIRHAVGEEHSTSASRVHQALAEKHGWEYQPQWGARDQVVSRDFDGAFGPYEYKLT